MSKFSPEQRHAIMAAVDTLLLQLSARVPLYQDLQEGSCDKTQQECLGSEGYFPVGV